jgi:polar amino acid transport system substrate-binding protein
MGRKTKQAHHKILRLQDECKSILSVMTDGIMILEKDNTLTCINESMANLLGVDPHAKILFRKDLPRVHVDGILKELDEVFATLTPNEPGGIAHAPHVRIQTRKADDIVGELYVGNVCIHDTRNDRRVVIIRDLREVFREIASGKRDPLTRLPNREKAYEDFRKLCSRHHLDEKPFALMIVSLDNFLVAQSMLGHDKTDQTILAVTETIRSLASLHTFEPYHLSYGSFLLVIQSVESLQQVHALAATIQEHLSALYGEHRSAIYLTASVGIAVYPESGKTTDLFDNAHKALIEAKKLGAGSTFLYHELKNEHRFDEAQLQLEIQFAVERNELMVFYQPIVDAKTHAIVGAEALMRWKHPEHGIIPPFIFIPLMEKTGFIIEAGRFLIQEVIRQQATWKQFGFEEIFVSLNASMREIDTPDYIDYLSGQLREHHVDAQAIKIEVTESLAMSNAEKMLKTLSKLHATGVPISLDDFGTGYTSFSYLTHIPAETLKIDKSFIDHLLDDAKNQQVVRAIVEVGHALGMKVVAEGIENKQMATKLLEFGVDYLQGYYFAKPMPVYEFQGSLTKRTPDSPSEFAPGEQQNGLTLIDP